MHAWNRRHLPGYREIFLDVPEELLRQRDPKGLYAAEQAGRMTMMAGSSTPVELPLAPHLRLDASQPLEECVRLVLELLNH